jgi:anti-sigma28 factor (negative regulator of flagellin synthesis)
MNLKPIPSGLPVGPTTPTSSERPAVLRADAPPVPVPAAAAVQLQVSSAAASGHAVAAADDGLSDQALLDTLKKRVQSGEFEIDYGSLARNIIEDAVMAIGHRGGLSR